MMTLAYGDNPCAMAVARSGGAHQDWGKTSAVERIGKSLHDSVEHGKKPSLAAPGNQPRLRGRMPR